MHPVLYPFERECRKHVKSSNQTSFGKQCFMKRLSPFTVGKHLTLNVKSFMILMSTCKNTCSFMILFYCPTFRSRLIAFQCCTQLEHSMRTLTLRQTYKRMPHLLYDKSVLIQTLNHTLVPLQL